jgi:mono/diheme cytochrome c family protein
MFSSYHEGMKPFRLGSVTLSLWLVGFMCPAADAQDPVAYGKYLVEEVARCADCHTPEAADGSRDASKVMKGKVIDVRPIKPMGHWHKVSPDITPSGKLWASWGGGEAIKKYLMTGVSPTGHAAGAPMPPYKLKEADAAAIVAYLQTLK